MTSPDRNTRASELFLAACKLSPGERAAYLDKACSADAELRAEVEAMLARDGGPTDMLDPPTRAADPQSPRAAARSVASDRGAQRIRSYEILELIGRGGQGVVYRAHQGGTDRDVALKILRRASIGDDEHQGRFRREAKSAARLDHPNIVTVYEAGIARGLPYIAMEYVVGESLEQALRRCGTLPETRIVEIALAVGNGLQHAHSRGILHRDVKPGNILLAHDGGVKLTDFGLAKHEASVTSFQTQEGGLFGTVAFLSPEQSYGTQRIDVRTDVYSLGCTIYNMATGHVPFKGDNLFAIIDQHRRASRPLIRLSNARVSDALEALVLRAMAVELDERYQNVRELCEDLERINAALRAPEIVTGGLEQTLDAVDQINVVGRLIRDSAPTVKPARWQTRITAIFLSRPMFWLGLFVATLVMVAGIAFAVGMTLGTARSSE